MKFKRGDKVRILPLATSVMVAEDEVGKTGVITSISSLENNFNGIIVYMDKIRKGSGVRLNWIVESSMIEPAVEVGQQLLFNFMSATEGTKE